VAGTVPEERIDPLNQVWAHTLCEEEGDEGRRFHVVETSVPIEEESGDLVAEAVEGFNMVL